MPNAQAPQSQYDSIEADGQFEIVNVPIELEDDEDDEDPFKNSLQIEILLRILMEPIYFCFSILLEKCNY